MARVSKQKLSDETEKQLFSQFINTSRKASAEELGGFFGALFTETERIIVIKRLAAVFLVTEGYSAYAIAKTLVMSDSTVRNVQSHMLRGRYDPIMRLMKKRSFDKKEFWQTIETLLECGLPPRGKGRWKWLYEMEDVPTIVRMRKKRL